VGDTFGRTHGDHEHVLRVSNGGAAVFLDVLALAAGAVARTDWQLRFALLCCDSRIGAGNDGFDLAELPWTPGWPSDHAFLRQVVATARTRHGWDHLSYTPPYADDYLAIYAEVVSGYTPTWPLEPQTPLWPDAPTLDLTTCPAHPLYLGSYSDCRLCPQ
jgi:hypothetical protein